MIDKETYKIESINYYRSKNKKTQIILAGSLRQGNNHIKRLYKKRFGKTKTWCTYTISREGVIYQHYDPKFYSDFIGIKDTDRKSISVVLENMGALYYDYDQDGYFNWIGEQCDEDVIIEKNWKGYRYWESYTDEQHDSVIQLCEELCNRFKIDVDSLGYNVMSAKAYEFNGIITRSNLNPDFNDVNPSFDFKYFMNGLGIKY